MTTPTPVIPLRVPFLLCAACTEAEAARAFALRFGTPPAAVIVERIGIFAGPVPGKAKESEK